MKFEKKEFENLKTGFSVVVEKDFVSPAIDEWIKEHANIVKVPGFRPGKAPKDVIKGTLMSKAINNVIPEIISKKINEILRNENDKPLTTPAYSIEKYDESGDLHFYFEYSRSPSFDLIEISTIEMEKIKHTVSEEDVQKEFEKFKREFKSLREVTNEKPVENDFLEISVDITPINAGKNLENLKIFLIHGRQNSEFHMLLDSNLKNSLIGEEVLFEYTPKKSDGEQITQFVGKKVLISTKIQKISRFLETEITEEVLKNELNFDSFLNLKESIKNRIVSERNNFVWLCNKRGALDKLAEIYSFEIPEEIVENDFKKIWEIVCREEAKNDEFINASELEINETKAEYLEVCKRRVRLGFVISKIAELEKIEINDEIIKIALVKELKKYEEKDYKKVIKYYSKNKNALMELVSPFIEDFVVKRILEKSGGEFKEVSFEDLKIRINEVIPYEDSSSFIDENEEIFESNELNELMVERTLDEIPLSIEAADYDVIDKELSKEGMNDNKII